MKKLLILLLLVACQGPMRLKTGDLIFVASTSGEMDGAISAATGAFTHVAMLEVAGDSLWVIDAHPSHGVSRRTLSSFLEENGADEDEEPRPGVLHEQEEAAHEGQVRREKAFRLQVRGVGEVVRGQGGDDDGRQDGEQNPADDEKGRRDAGQKRPVGGIVIRDGGNHATSLPQSPFRLNPCLAAARVANGVTRAADGCKMWDVRRVG